MKLSAPTLLQFVLVVLFLLSLVAGAGSGEFIVLAAISALLYGSTWLGLHFAVRHRLVFLKVYCFFFSFWYLLRLPVLAAYPAAYAHTGISGLLTHDALIRGLVYLFVFHAISLATIALIDRRMPQAAAPGNASYPGLNFRRLLAGAWVQYGMVVICTLTLSYILQNRLADTFTAMVIDMVFGWGLPCAAVSILTVFHYRRFSRWLKFCVGLWVAVFVTMQALGGSKGGFYAVATCCVLTALVADHVRVRITAARVAMVAVLVPLVLFVYHAGAVIRLANRYLPEQRRTPAAAIRYALQAPYDVEETFVDATNRLSLLDSFLMLVELDDQRQYHDVSVINAGKSIVNLMVPGDVFPGVRRIGQMFRRDYQGFDIDSVEEVYHTDVFGIWGVGLGFSNRFAGGLVAASMLLIDLVLIGAILRRVAIRYRGYVTALLSIHFYGCLNMMGPDDFLVIETLSVVLEAVVFTVVLRLISGSWPDWFSRPGAREPAGRRGPGVAWAMRPVRP